MSAIDNKRDIIVIHCNDTFALICDRLPLNFLKILTRVMTSGESLTSVVVQRLKTLIKQSSRPVGECQPTCPNMGYMSNGNLWCCDDRCENASKITDCICSSRHCRRGCYECHGWNTDTEKIVSAFYWQIWQVMRKAAIEIEIDDLQQTKYRIHPKYNLVGGLLLHKNYLQVGYMSAMYCDMFVYYAMMTVDDTDGEEINEPNINEFDGSNGCGCGIPIDNYHNYEHPMVWSDIDFDWFM
jgi:hypothetical protein